MLIRHVSLYLPYFNGKTVKDVIKALNDNEAIAPSETGSSHELVTLKRNLAYSDVFSAMSRLVTYDVDSVRKQPALRRLMALSRALGNDALDGRVQRETLWGILDKMDAEVARLSGNGTYEEQKEKIIGFAESKVVYEYGTDLISYDAETNEVSVASHDIDHRFEQAGKLLGEGLHRQYWKRHIDQNSVEIKTAIIIMANDTTAMDNLERYAENRFNTIWNEYQSDIGTLPEARKTWYRRLVRSSTTPLPEKWNLPESIDFREYEDSQPFEHHLYVKEDGTFKASLNPWEAGVVKEELEGEAVCWLRNLDRKSWSLGIPYEVNGMVSTMYPDLIIVRSGTYGYIFDIMEPHDESRKDNYTKAVGLAKFADQHWDKFGRIQLIRRKPGPDGRDHFYRLDMSNQQIRSRVRAIHSNPELDHIFDECATLN